MTAAAMMGCDVQALLAAAAKLPDGKRVSRERRRAITAAIEAERILRNLPLKDLCARAGISPQAYAGARDGRWSPRAATLRRLTLAVSGSACDQPRHGERLKRLALLSLTHQLAAAGLDGQTLRDAALYAAHVELGFKQAELAAMAGLTRQRVQSIVVAIEDRRDDEPALARALAALEPALEAAS